MGAEVITIITHSPNQRAKEQMDWTLWDWVKITLMAAVIVALIAALRILPTYLH